MIAAFIFDMDGTLLDTEKLATWAWDMAAKEMNMSFDRRLLFKMKGAGLNQAKAFFDAAYHGKPSFEEARFVRDKYFFSRVWEEPDLVLPGAREILAFLKNHQIKIALATSSRREYSQSLLKKMGLISFFDEMVFGEEVSLSKPNPDIFLEAAKRIDVPPAQCAVVEDSANGVMAGYSGGFFVVGIPNSYPFSEKTKAECNLVLPSLLSLLGLLKEGQAKAASFCGQQSFHKPK